MPTPINNLSPRAQTLLDTALAGETDAVKARILQLVLEAGINPEEEFFLISLGLNHLKLLLYDTPQQFQQWSDALKNELDAWADSYEQTLHLIAQKAEVTASLTETAAQLATLLTGHTQTCNALLRQLQVSHQTWGESWEQQAKVNAETHQMLTSLSKNMEQQTAQLRTQLDTLAVAVKASHRHNPLKALGLHQGNGWKQAVFYVATCSLLIGSMAMSALTAFYIQDRPLLRSTALKVEYLLQKQNRRDCLEGIKAADSVECQL